MELSLLHVPYRGHVASVVADSMVAASVMTVFPFYPCGQWYIYSYKHTLLYHSDNERYTVPHTLCYRNVLYLAQKYNTHELYTNTPHTLGSYVHFRHVRNNIPHDYLVCARTP